MGQFEGEFIALKNPCYLVIIGEPLQFYIKHYQQLDYLKDIFL